jgi:CRISPR-associated protein (Cas_csx3)
MTVNVDQLYAATGTAKLAELPAYESRVKELVPPGADVNLTGPGPVWLYLRLAHALHGRARKLIYDSPVTGPVEIFNHDPR